MKIFLGNVFLQVLSVVLSSMAMICYKLALIKCNPLFVLIISVLGSGSMALVTLIIFRKMPLYTINYIELIQASLLNFLGLLLLIFSLDVLDPVVTTVLGRCSLLFSTIFALVILKEKITKSSCVFSTIGLIGLILFLYNDQLIFEKVYISGIIFVLSYSFIFSYVWVILRKNSQKEDRITFLSLVMILTLVFILFFISSISCHKYIHYAIENRNECILVITGGILSFLSVLSFFYGIQNIKYTYAIFIRSLSPIVTMILSIPFFTLAFSAINIFGMVICFYSLISISIINYKHHKYN